MSKLTDNYAEIAAAIGFRYDAGCNVLYGQRDGFDIVLYAADSRYPYFFTLHTAAKSTNGIVLTKERTKELVKSRTDCALQAGRQQHQRDTETGKARKAEAAAWGGTVCRDSLPAQERLCSRL
mgnify:CR=1 FL=1